MRPEPLSPRNVYVVVKFISPAMYALFLCLGVAVALLGGTTMLDQLPLIGRVLLVVVVGPLAAMAYTAFLWDLKYVELDGDRLLVSGVHRKTTIPVSDVADIHQNFIEPGYPIYVHLKHPCMFGKTFSFVGMPPVGWTIHEEYPVVERLRTLARVRAKGLRDGAAA